MTLLAMLAAPAFGYVDPACQEVADQGPPDNYSEQAQNDFLLNYVALAGTYSALHAPVPAEPGHGSIGLELSGIPPLGCERRLVLAYSKTEDTNKTPVLPRPRLTFALPALGKVVPYASFAYLPPVTLLGTRNVIISGEVGAGARLDSGLELGGRFHATTMKTVGEIATPFVEGEEAYLDLYLGTTFGLDLMGGWKLGNYTPYLALGVTDVSTFFYIGDDNYIGNNYSPYFGPVASVGTQANLGHLELAGEFYTAPMNMNTGDLVELDGEAAAAFAPSRIYTGRLRVAWAF